MADSTTAEFVRELFERFQAGDPSWLEAVDPDIEWDFSAFPIADIPDRGRGRQSALQEVIATYMSGWRDLRQEIVEVIDAGDNIIAVVHETVGVRGSDAELEREIVHVVTVQEGKFTMWRVYETREEALAAAGFSGVVAFGPIALSPLSYSQPRRRK